MCKYCKEDEMLLQDEIEKFDDICLFMKKDEDTIATKVIKQFIGTEKLRVFIDRGYLRVTIGDDIGCLDHSVDRIKINFCPNCGEKIED